MNGTTQKSRRKDLRLSMKIGDKVRATWTDGLVLVGKYTDAQRGYVILIDEKGFKIVCDPNHVVFEVIDEL